MLWQTLAQLLRNNESAQTATLVAVRGHHACTPGARLLIRSDGTTVGRVGGGAVEAAVLDKAPRFLELWSCVLLNLPGEEGAEVTVFLETWQPEPSTTGVAERLAGVDGTGEPLALATIVAGGLDGAVIGGKLLVDERGARIGTLGRAELNAEAAQVAAGVLRERKARLVELARGDEIVFVEPVLPQPEPAQEG